MARWRAPRPEQVTRKGGLGLRIIAKVVPVHRSSDAAGGAGIVTRTRDGHLRDTRGLPEVVPENETVG
jgi:hypothetical protein